MKLTVLGSGTCVPRVDRATPGYFLETDSSHILIDCSVMSLQQMLKAGKDYREIDILVLNHLHADHVAGLPALLQAMNWTPGYDRKKPLYIYAHDSFQSFFDNLAQLMSGAPREDTYDIDVFGLGSYIFGDLQVTLVQGNHAEHSAMVKFEDSGKTLVYTGDTAYGREVVEFASGADLLVTECSYPDGVEPGTHMVPATLGRLLSEARPKRALISHIYPNADAAGIEDQLRNYYDGSFEIAKDLCIYEPW